MGQYYNIVLNKKAYPSDYKQKDGEKHWNGMKLLEFNWLKNPITQIIAKTLYEKRTRLALVGDYSDDIFRFDRDFIEEFSKGYPELRYYYQLKEKAIELGYKGTNTHYPQVELSFEKIQELYKLAWRNEDQEEELLEEPEEEFRIWEEMYFLNHSKKEYIDLKEYIEKSTTKDGWCISPFIITALGNGMGGGDYRLYRSKKNPDINEPPHMDDIGYWAYDLLSIEEEIPKNYKKINIYFKEED